MMKNDCVALMLNISSSELFFMNDEIRDGQWSVIYIACIIVPL